MSRALVRQRGGDVRRHEVGVRLNDLGLPVAVLVEVPDRGRRNPRPGDHSSVVHHVPMPRELSVRGRVASTPLGRVALGPRPDLGDLDHRDLSSPV